MRLLRLSLYILAACFSFDSSGAVVFVNANATGAGNGSSWTDAYTSIQPAIDAANVNDEVWVAAGAYVSTSTPVVALKAGVAIYGGFDGSGTLFSGRDWTANVCAIDGENARQCVVGASNAVLDGFTVRNGAASTGAGMYNASCTGMTVANCSFSGNAASTYGGGVYNTASSPAFSNCTFVSNTAVNDGGGMYNAAASNPTLTDCTFETNTAGSSGGGVFNTASSPVLTDCVFTENRISPQTSWSNGGAGLSSTGGSAPTLSGCQFTGNTSTSSGGGLFVRSASASLTDCVFTNNHADCDGGAIFNRSSGTSLTDCVFTGNSAQNPVSSNTYGGALCNYYNPAPTLSNCLFSGNHGNGGGGAMLNFESSPSVTECDFQDNDSGDSYGGAIYNYHIESAPVISDCTFTRNTTPDRGGAIYNHQAAPIISECEFTQNTSGDEGGAIDNRLCGPACIERNCTFTNNTAAGSGGGIYNNESSATIEDCDFYGNIVLGTSSGGGGGVGNYGENGTAASTISRCRFYNNQAGFAGGGVLNDVSKATVERCLFSGNTAMGGAAVCGYLDASRVVNCVASENTASYFGGAVFNYSGTSAYVNCTFAFNTAATGGGGMVNYANAAPVIINCILWGNKLASGTLSEIESLGATPNVTYSCVEGGYAGAGNIVADPLFTDAEHHLFTVRSGSPCIDTGTPANAPDDDYNGLIRPQDYLWDMGAFESPRANTEPCAFLVDVDNASGVENGRTWATAYASIAAALRVAAAGDEVWVAEGTYTAAEAGATVVTMKAGVAIYGGFDATETKLEQRDPAAHITIIGGAGAHRCVVGAADAALDGFTVSNGAADNGAGMRNDGVSPAVTNCIFTNNTATANGGGMYNANGAAPAVTGCAFTANTAASGGGMYNTASSPALENCTFTNNTLTGANHGAGMRNEASSPTLTDCTFTGNVASRFGGGMSNHTASAPVLTRCAFSGNRANAPSSFGGGGALYNAGVTVTANACTFDGNYTLGTYANAGGLYNTASSSMTLTDCAVSNNYNDPAGGNPYGGGISNSGSYLAATRCQFTGNTTGSGGGALSSTGASTVELNACTLSGNSAPGGAAFMNYAALTAVNCLIHDNSSSVYSATDGTTTLVNCTVANNGVGACLYDGSLALTNCILWNTGAELNNFTGSPLTVTNCCVEGGFAGGTDIVSGDPLFVNAAGANFQLQPTSPCVNAGLAAGAPATDLLGIARPIGAGYDIGAYEASGVTAWPTASGIVYGQTLASSTLTGGAALILGVFAFQDSSIAPNAGVYTATVLFTPDDLGGNPAATGVATVAVAKATPSVTTWPTASAIVYGQKLKSSTLSGGVAAAPGTFAFNSPNVMLDAGTYLATVKFTPADAANYLTTTHAVFVTVNKALPAISPWPAASAIGQGQSLAFATLTGGNALYNGTVVAGAFALSDTSYIPTPPGTYYAAVVFTPDNTDNYLPVNGTIPVIVEPADCADCIETAGAYIAGDTACLAVPGYFPPGTPFQWEREDGTPIDTPRASGLYCQRLQLDALEEADSGVYRCTYGATGEIYTVVLEVGSGVPARPGMPAFIGIIALFALASARRVHRYLQENR